MQPKYPPLTSCLPMTSVGWWEQAGTKPYGTFATPRGLLRDSLQPMVQFGSLIGLGNYGMLLQLDVLILVMLFQTSRASMLN